MARGRAKSDTVIDNPISQAADESMLQSTGKNLEAPPSPAQLDDSLEEEYHTAEEKSDYGEMNTDAPLLPLELLRATETPAEHHALDIPNEAASAPQVKRRRQPYDKSRLADVSEWTMDHLTIFAPQRRPTKRDSEAIRNGRIRKKRRAEPPSSSTRSGKEEVLLQRLAALSPHNADVRPQRSVKRSRGAK